MRHVFSKPAILLMIAASFGTLTMGLTAPSMADEKPAANSAEKDAAAATAEPTAEEQEEYFELLTLFADTLDQIDRNYVKSVGRRELMEAAIEGVLSKLDPYSTYIPPEVLERFKTGVDSEFGGIGIQISIENGELKVISPLYGTPAYEAGILSGDKITKIEGETAKGISLDEAVRRLKGKPDSSVTLTVQHAHNSESETLTLEREIIRVDTVMGDHRKDDDTWDFMYDPESLIGYVRVTAFSRHTGQDLRKALDELTAHGMKGMILDLRFNPGGLLSSAVEVSDTFVSKGRIVSTKGRNTRERVWNAQAKDTYAEFSMAILVNRYSASASEIVAACLQDHDRAVVIGERTWGKGSVQNIIELESGKSALKLTTAGYRRPSGKNIHRFGGSKENEDWGVHPNDSFEVKLTEAEMGRLLRQRRDRDILIADAPDEAGEDVDGPEEGPPNSEANSKFVDRQLEKALDYLNQQLAKR